MVPTSHLLAFVVASVVLTAVPGPSVLFVIGRSLALGRRAGLLSVVGNTLGLLPLVVAVALGVGAVVQRSVVVFTALKLAGAAYLVYLGVQAFRHRHHGAGDAVDERPRSARRIVREGFVVGVSNPKAVVFLAAVLPQFAEPAAGAVAAQVVVLGLVFMAVALLSDGLWAVVAGTARGWLGGSPRRLARMQAGGGLMMIGLGGSLALTGQKA
ncbi:MULTISPECIES: LysE family translocator [unclassified Nocardioides]|uniref:LysE family translocator n=1 Tax=unclassified Nocardioides TaxID=2615069 RepID=UPI0030144C46